MQVVVDASVLLLGRLDLSFERSLQFLALAGGAHEGDDGQQLAVVVGGRGDGSFRDTSWTEVVVSARLGDMTTPRLTATKMAEAAQAWLERLDDEQRSVGQ